MKDIELKLTAKAMRRIAVGAVAAIVMIPTAVIAAGGAFTDDDTSVFEANIEWLAASGVTQGCNPPTNDQFCPEDNVSRGQMAAFMQRFAQYLGAEDGTPAESDNADTLDSLDSTEIMSAAASGASDAGDPEALAAVVSVTLTAPADGYVIANSDMQLNLLHINGASTQASMGLSTSPTAFTQNHQDNSIGVPSGAPTGNYFQSPALTGAFEVSAGEVTIYLLATEDSGSVTYNDATLTAFWVPAAAGALAEVVDDGGVDPAE